MSCDLCRERRSAAATQVTQAARSRVRASLIPALIAAVVTRLRSALAGRLASDRGRAAGAAAAGRSATPQLPYVYTKWKHFTAEDGLPNDHIFAVKVGRPARLGRHRGRPGAASTSRPGKVVKTLAGEGRPALQGGDGHRRGPEDRRRLARAVRRRAGALQRRALRPLAPAQQRPGQRRRLRRRRRERQRLGRDHGRARSAQHGDRRVDDLHREERAHGGDLELRRQLRRQGQGLPRRLGQRRPRVRRRAPSAGRSTSTRTARWRSTSTATTASST